MLPPIFGKIIYFFGYPLFRLLIKNTNRTYILVEAEGKFLLTKNWLGKQEKWRLPGGGIIKKESPAAAVTRELKEEVGIIIEEKQLIALNHVPIRSKFHYNYFLFKVLLNELPEVKPDKREILTARFINYSDTKKLLLGEEAAKAIELDYGP